jgi:hypothetical protein
MKSPSFAVLFLVTTAAAARSDYTIVTNESLNTYYHELCHANGWRHPFGAEVQAPAWCMHRYKGGILRIIVVPDDPLLTGTVARYAQPGAEVSYSADDAETVCMAFWRAKGTLVPDHQDQTIVGCAIDGN